MDILALLLLGTLAGNELAVSAFVHPTLSRLLDEQHAAGAKGLARVYGKVAPFWYAATLLTLIALAWRTPQGQFNKSAFVVSAVLMVTALVLTLTLLVPINNRIANLNLNALSDNWKVDRALWDKFHALRVVLLLLSLAALALGAVRG